MRAPEVPRSFWFLVLPCLLSMAAWEGARLLLPALPALGAATPVVWSAVRAALLLVPPALMTRRVLGEPVAQGLWLGPPARDGLVRAVVTGGLYLVLINGLGAALGAPFVLPSVSLIELVQVFFDAAVEEAFFRGFLLSHLLPGRRFAVANVLQALVFVIPHTRMFLGLWGQGVGAALVVIVLSVFVLGFVLGGTARPVRSVWVATVVHAINNLLASV
jgi:membrane protease YdiL (CAAX protease family)